MTAKRVAIVGGGCSGIAALWALRSTDHDVHIFESSDRLGGHANTLDFVKGDLITPVDTAFVVINEETYPNFSSFLKFLNVDCNITDMSWGMSRDEGAFEWASRSLSALFAQRSNLIKPAMWRMVFDIVRFNEFALDVLSNEFEDESDPSGAHGFATPPHAFQVQETIGDYLRRERYSDIFRDEYLIPMTAAIWSTGPDKYALNFPVVTLIRFMWNHHLLNTVAARPTWLTIKGGSRAYIDIIASSTSKDRIHLSSPVFSVTNDSNGKVVLRFANGQHEIFDHVIMACHGDTALSLIAAGASAEEKKILSAFETTLNEVYMHSDTTLMPRRRSVWSAWNYLSSSDSSSHMRDRITLTYWSNRLQQIPEDEFGPVLVTLNPITPPAKALTQAYVQYRHPLYNTAAINAQSLLPRIQNKRGISFCGAWTKFGFHEDGFSSGLKVAVEHLGANLPFQFKDATFSRGRRPVYGFKDSVARTCISVLQSVIDTSSAVSWAFRGRKDNPLVYAKEV